MKKLTSEEQIRARLRELTIEVRRLRNELTEQRRRLPHVERPNRAAAPKRKSLKSG